MTFLKKKKEAKDKSYYLNALKTVAVVILAFVSALLFRRSAGVLATLPLAITIFATTAFIRINFKIKLTIFGITVFALNTVETSDVNATLHFVALCLLACLLFEAAVKLIKQYGKIGLSAFVISFALCVALSFMLLGNPVDAIKSNNILKEYTESKYSTESDDSSTYVFSKIYYNYRTKAFEIQGYGTDSPTEIGSISVKGETISDSLKSIVQKNLTQPYVLEITEVLRHRFPDDSFSVRADEIYKSEGIQVITAEKDELYGRIAFEINLGGVQTANKMAEKVAQYTEVLDNAGINYGKIVYKSGISPWVKRSATVDKSRPLGKHNFSVTHVPVSTSNRFNRFTQSLLTRK